MSMNRYARTARHVAGRAVCAAALAGGTMLAAADLIARTVVAPRQLPVGAIMALVGAPIFLALLRAKNTNTH